LVAHAFAQQRARQQGHEDRRNEEQSDRFGKRQRRKGHVIGGIGQKQDQAARQQAPEVRADQIAQARFGVNRRGEDRQRHDAADHDGLRQRVVAADRFDDRVLRREDEYAKGKRGHAGDVACLRAGGHGLPCKDRRRRQTAPDACGEKALMALDRCWVHGPTPHFALASFSSGACFLRSFFASQKQLDLARDVSFLSIINKVQLALGGRMSSRVEPDWRNAAQSFRPRPDRGAPSRTPRR